MIAFVRHGQTAANRDGQLQGRADPPLTDLGEAQARAVAAALASTPVTRVVASPLQRAIATARAIADAHGLSVDIDDRLVELDYGDWDARGLRDVSPEEWDAWRADVHFTPPGGESLVSVTARIVEFCVEQAADGFTVAVSHVSPIKAAVCWALGVDERASWRMHLDLATVTRVGRRGNAPYLASYNESALTTPR